MALLDVLKALRLKMTGNSELSAAITGVFDEEAPRSQKSPYCVIGYASEREGRLIADTERRGTVRVHIWSEKKSKLEVLQIYEILDRVIPDDFFIFEDFGIVPDPSSGWTHGVLEYRFYYDREDRT